MLIGWKAATHDPRIASFRFRVQEPLAALRERGHQVELFSPQRADRYDLTIFCKSYRPADQEIARAARARGGLVALDLCDNHFYNPYRLPRYEKAREELLAMIALANRVTVSTPALGAVVRAEAGLGRDPFVVGDAAERIALPPRPLTGGPDRTLLWFGSHGSPNAPSGMNDLIGIAAHLRAAHAETPFELVVASNNREKFDALAPRMGVPMRYVEWTHEGFPTLLAQADAVVIPLSDNPFVACKTHNRITTALWPGVPVVADAIESYREFQPFCYLDDWREGLRAVLREGDAARGKAAQARAYIDRTWSVETLAPQWEAALGLTAAPAVRTGDPAPAGPGVQYQGALDPPGSDRVTGWARIIARPSEPVGVTLEVDGRVLARARADAPRPDLAAVGFEHSACGFELPVPASWRDGAVRHFSVVVDGGHELEGQRASFGTSGGPAAQPAPSLAEQLRAVGALAASLGETRSSPDQVREEMRVQRLLADELEALSEAVENVRRTAARIVLAAGGRGREPLENGVPRADGR